MKDHNNAGSAFVSRSKDILRIIAILFIGQVLYGQDPMAQEKDATPVKRTFESIMLMDQQTVMVPVKGTFEMDFQHRFGTWDTGYDNLYGIFAPSNIRIGLDYVPAERLMVGFGFTKENLVWDMFGKYALLRQGQSGGSPVSLTYYGNAAIDTRSDEDGGFSESTDRWSFFHAAMVARKFSDDFSLQLSGNLSWFNDKDFVMDDEGMLLGKDGNAHFSASALARYKFSNVMSLTVGYDQPITDHTFFDPEPNLSIGLEVVTSSHAFQVFVGNFHRLVPQYNHSFNANSFGNNQILIGFNITRLWNF